MEALYGRMEVLTKRYPDARPFIWSLQKHLRFAMLNPDSDKYKKGKLLQKSKDWLREMRWKHPMFREDFGEMADLIEKYEQS